ncbi:hypothetical protein HZC31_01380 [Candidatus Woesearchaeota archaeon]|nr:hypothetical protein [Candidatus Woesearchaeota archaeon]
MIDKSELLAWLAEKDKILEKEIILVAVGGTAMTLLGLKSSTIDVDFCLSAAQKKIFEKLITKRDKNWKVDLFTDGYIFSEQLPHDYVDKAEEIKRLNHVVLKALAPVDIVITKAARLNARDEEDIAALVKFVNKEELIKRFEKVVTTYAGKEEEYRYHFGIILKRFFNQ